MVLRSAVDGYRGENRGKPELVGPHRPAREPVVTHVPRDRNRIPDYTIAKPDESTDCATGRSPCSGLMVGGLAGQRIRAPACVCIPPQAPMPCCHNRRSH